MSRNTKRTAGARRAKRVRMSRAAREQQLLDVAEELFTHGGFGSTSIEDIARAAGVTRPILYNHFGDRDGILVACVARARRELEQRLSQELERLGSDADKGELFEAGGDVFFAMLEAKPERWMLLFSNTTALSGDVAERLTALRFGTIEHIAQLVRRVAPDADAGRLQAAAHAIAGVAEQLGRWWLRSRGVSRKRIVRYYRELIVGGVVGLLDPSLSVAD